MPLAAVGLAKPQSKCKAHSHPLVHQIADKWLQGPNLWKVVTLKWQVARHDVLTEFCKMNDKAPAVVCSCAKPLS